MKSKLPWMFLLILIFLSTFDLVREVYFSTENVDHLKYILWEIRVPTVLTALLAGGILSLTGLNYQYLFQNHLASPYTLGMASAAAFGAATYTMLAHFMGDIPGFLQPILGILFSILTIFILLRFLDSKNIEGIYRVLLAGIACSLIFSSLIILIQYIVGNRDGFELMVSLLGNVSMVGYLVPMILLVLLLLTVSVIYKNFSSLRLMSVNYEYFQSLSGHSKSTFYQLIIIPSIATAYLVTEIGPISFVGLIIPHLIRLFIRPQGKNEITLNLVVGGSFLLLCSMLSKIIVPGIQIPVGVVTSILGGLFLIVVLFR